MYRLLIVDDERIARESVYGLLATQEDLELELLTADSAVRAVSILETERVDITIMDINMPQMTGLELYSIVRQKWPQCKVIFLTGYSEFDYVYQVHKHAKYVLKADREEVLLEAVRESIREIENEMIIQRAAEEDPEFKRRAGSQRATIFINELIDGYISTDDVNNEVLRDMNIELDCRKPVYAVLARCEQIAEAPFQRSQSISEKCFRLLERYFSKNMRCMVVYYRKINFFILVQPEQTLEPPAEVRRLTGLCSLFQNALNLNAETDAKLLVVDRPLGFVEAIHAFGRLYDSILRVNEGDTQIMSLQTSGAEEQEQSQEDLQQMLMRIELDPETLGRDELLHAIRQARRRSKGVEDMLDLHYMEIYQRFCAIILRLVKQQEISQQKVFQMGIGDLYNLSSFRSWEQAFSRMESIAENVISTQEAELSEQEGNLVTRMKRYIERHLGEGPSLTAIADHYHFSREYLLRVFKREEGVTILQYINDLKLDKAKELLANPALQVKEVASVLGFSSTAYFIRFFRSKTGASPQAWRDQNNN